MVLRSPTQQLSESGAKYGDVLDGTDAMALEKSSKAAAGVQE